MFNVLNLLEYQWHISDSESSFINPPLEIETIKMCLFYSQNQPCPQNQIQKISVFQIRFGGVGEENFIVLESIKIGLNSIHRWNFFFPLTELNIFNPLTQLNILYFFSSMLSNQIKSYCPLYINLLPVIILSLTWN